MRREAAVRRRLDIRTKLLAMLALLSLPLLIISLLQLRSYQKSLNDQSATIARIEAEAAAAALETWVESHPVRAPLQPAEADDLYTRLRRRTTPGMRVAIAVFDAHGQPLTTGQSRAVPLKLPAGIQPEDWSDGTRLVTSVTRAEPSGWAVAVGLPPPEETPAGRAIFMTMAAWFFGVAASCLLAVWAVGRFTKPLERLATTASTLGGGDLQERVPVETDDEVGTLAVSLNAMAESLESKFDAVKRQSAFIGEVLDSLPLNVVVLDARLVVRKVNSAFAEATGRDPAKLTGRGLYDAAAGLAVLSETVEDVRRTRRAFVGYGMPLELAPRAGEDAGQDAQKFWDVIVWPVMEQSEGRGDLILILSEVSKRVRAERMAAGAFAAEKSRAAELASVINQMEEGVCIIDSSGRYRLNPAAAHILGRRAGEFQGGAKALIVDMTLRDMQGRVLPADETPICRALDGGEHVSGEHFKVVRRDGEERVLAVSTTPLAGDGSRAVGAVAVFRDITEGVRQHDELVSAYDRLKEHDRLKSAFVANMSHELRTPLNVIIGLCQLLARDPSLPLAPLQSEAIGRMERNAHSLLVLVNDMLDYSRLEAGQSALHLESLTVEEVVGAAARGFEAEARDKKLELNVRIEPGLGRVLTDRRKLSQVVKHLVGNALKFTDTGSVEVRAAADGAGRWYLEVEDTGIGISDEAQAYIFEDFRQVDDRLTRSYSGVGLGLAITRKIVELLEGEIQVESRPNEGSRFRITWPRQVRQRTGTGSLVAHARDEAQRPPAFRPRVRAV
ncbi:MAG TPA: ATP-binding protein [Pyrinomonadaceae bacterium]|nr:ATP-binding protein [Pyrinomonadaceae bacterium]